MIFLFFFFPRGLIRPRARLSFPRPRRCRFLERIAALYMDSGLFARLCRATNTWVESVLIQLKPTPTFLAREPNVMQLRGISVRDAMRRLDYRVSLFIAK